MHEKKRIFEELALAFPNILCAELNVKFCVKDFTMR